MRGWFHRQSVEELRWLLGKIEDWAETHGRAAEWCREHGYEDARLHQMALKDRCDQDAEKLRRKLDKREHGR
jgi:hypothetical protein